MTFLPIVERELRVAARRNRTFVIRWAGALVALLLAGLGSLAGGMGRAGPAGKYVFNFVSFYVFIFALFGGVFLAADCLSRERREGTLGFLFLTELKGYDVVLGKFMAVSLNAFYGLLAVLPVLALSLLAGGVTGPEVERMSLALVNTLFFSVTAAIWISSRTVSAYRAMTSSICLLVGLLAVAQVAHVCMNFVPARFAGLLFYLWVPSPSEPFMLAREAGYMYQVRAFWLSLGVSNLFGWAFLGLAAWSLPRRIGSAEENGSGRLLPAKLQMGRSQRRSALLEVNPVLWWLDDSRGLRWLAWALAIGGGALLWIAASGGTMAAMFNSYLAWPVYFLLKVFFAIQACRFFSEARRTGSLELFHTTPLTRRAILQGQWMALRKLFLWPVALFMAVQVAAVLGADYSRLSGVPLMNMYAPLGVLWQIGRSIADFFAIGWFGMWLALNGKKPEMAAGLTILFVVLLPAVAFCIPTFAIDVVFIVAARSKLLEQARNPSLVLGGKPGY